MIGDINLDVVKFIEKLKNFVKDIDWIEEHLSDAASYNWRQMLELLSFLSKILSDEQLSEIINQHPSFLFEESGGRTFSLIGFLLKFELSMKRISVIFLEFPRIQIGKFLSNLRNCFLLLIEIEMEAAEVGKIFCSHSLLLGSFTLERTNSLLANWVLGRKNRITQERIESQVQNLQARFDCFVEAGLDCEDVCAMAKVAYQNFCRSVDEINKKIHFLVK